MRTLLIIVAVTVAVGAGGVAFAQDQPRRGGAFIGVRMTDLDDVSAEDLELDSNRGVLIIHVVPQSPAEAAGIRGNDVIRRFDGHTVDSRRELADVLRQMRPGQVVVVMLIRQSEPMELTLTLGERPPETERVRPELPN